ncbi:MAG: hypothetical protein M3N98_15525 [Actinomycetota bacterium]|nr:hypothetical protein [Actinomycetota bacterium]
MISCGDCRVAARVFGVKFRPAGFRPFLGKPIAKVAGQRLPTTTVFGPAVDDLARVVGAAADVNDLVVVIDGFLRA